MDDRQFHKISQNSAIFIYQAFAKGDLIANQDIIRDYFKDFDSPSNTLKRFEILKNRDQEIKNYIDAIKSRNRFYMIVTVRFPTYKKKEKQIEIAIPSISNSSISATKVLHYVYDEPIGIIEIYVENIGDSVLLPANENVRKFYDSGKNQEQAFVKIYGKITDVSLSRAASSSLDQMLGAVSKTTRKIALRAERLKLYLINGKKLAEHAFLP